MPKARLLTTLLLASVSACYGADVDAELNATYACIVDSDCAVGHTCLSSLCTDGTAGLGPAPFVQGPELLTPFEAGVETMLPIVIGGEGLTLVEPGGSNAPGEGHLEIRIDGELFATLTEGDLDGRVETEPFTIPSAPGFHRIEALALQNDGAPFPNDLSRANSGFWVNDGREHIAILRPAPGQEVHVDESRELEVEIATLNFRLVNPQANTDRLTEPGQGHFHVFFDTGIPDCLPGCNSSYESTGIPRPGDPDAQLVVEGGIGADTPGVYPLEVVAQNSAHDPYFREDGELLFDVIEIAVVSP